MSLIPIPIDTSSDFSHLAVFTGIIAKAVYNVYFHPLSKYPGPALSAISDWIYLFHWTRGDLVKYILRTHQEYGPIVRISTNRVGFTDGRAWKDVYGHKTASQRKVENVKDPQIYGPESNGRYSLLATFNDVDHGQLRKLFTHGFSERALKSQEHLIRANVDKLIRNIDQSLASNPKVPLDFVRLFNCVTFDTTGELAFGETLGLLDGNDKMYRWVDSIIESTILSPYLQILSGFPLALKAVYALLPKQTRLSLQETGRYSSDLVDKRLEKGLVTETADFWTLILKANQDKRIDVEDMKANASLFMASGTETTATMLSGFMFNILSNPEKLEKVVKEVRESFTSAEELTSSNIQKLKYLAACCDESMRCKYLNTYPKSID